MKLQVALDYFTLEDAFELMEKIYLYVDIIEIGSPLIYAEGFRAIIEMKRRYPEKLVLADMKIVDGGYDIASAAYDAGADIVTSIGMTNNATLRGVVHAAHERNKKVMIDTIGVINLADRVCELENMGVDYILVHTAHDMLGCLSAPIEALKVIKDNVKNTKVGISGGITVEQLPKICELKPDWIVVGSGIVLAKNPLEVAKNFKKSMLNV